MTDFELLCSYASTGSNDAFAQLVSRYLAFVYSSALRQTRSSALAEDITQAVFLDLARHARKIRPGTHLASWLCVSTRQKAIDAIRTESRRREREKIAMELAAINLSDSAWTQLAPLLDEALAVLNEADRRAVLLRFFENQSLADIGRQLGVTDDTAQKRVARALDRLRHLLARRGLTTTAAVLATQLPAHAVSAAPIHLAQLVTSSVAVSAAPASAGFAQTLLMTFSKKSLLGGALALALAGALYESVVIRDQRRQLASARTLASTHRQEIARLQTQLDTAEQYVRKLGATAPVNPTSPQDPVETRIRTILARVQKLKRMLSLLPDEQIPEMQFMSDNNWIAIAMHREPETPEEYQRALVGARSQAKFAFAHLMQTALRKYVAESNGELPAQTVALAPYFDPPLNPAILERYEMRAKGNAKEFGPQDILVAEKPSVLFDATEPTMEIAFKMAAERDATSPAPSSPAKPLDPAIEIAGREASQAYSRDHHGEIPKNMEQIRAYFKNSGDAEKFSQYYADRDPVTGRPVGSDSK